jgi:hypothetical protein
MEWDPGSAWLGKLVIRDGGTIGATTKKLIGQKLQVLDCQWVVTFL